MDFIKSLKEVGSGDLLFSEFKEYDIEQGFYRKSLPRNHETIMKKFIVTKEMQSITYYSQEVIAENEAEALELAKSNNEREKDHVDEVDLNGIYIETSFNYE